MEDLPTDFLRFYDSALSQVYGYLLPRCGGSSVAEELTAETFLAAVDAARRKNPPPINVPWVIGVARHKLVDHWRRSSRETSGLRRLTENYDEDSDDLGDDHLDAVQARATLATLAAHHRGALTLRYLDDLSVPDVADLLGRTVHATEALLARARRAFRVAYEEQTSGDEERFDD
jgi:RNA polymerase sigma-70 factor (ECF subfamily)